MATRQFPSVRESLSRRLGPLICATAFLAALSTPTAVFAKAMPSDVVDGSSAASRHLSTAALPDVSMKAGVLVDNDGRVLWARRLNTRRAMASITKIMTAVVVLEHTQPGDSVTIPAASGTVGQSTANLIPGERLPVRDVLTAMLVKSGNDAAVALAIHVAGNEADFVKMMNDKAAELGLKNTRFTNPHGLDETGHKSTAYDLSVLARYAMSNPLFAKIVAMKTALVGTGARRRTLHSTDLLLGNYAGAMGVKTGNTDDAGYSVVSAAQRDGVILYAVVLGTSSDMQRFRDARETLDWGFAHYRPQALATANTVVGEAPVTDYLDVSVPVAISQDATTAVLDFDGPITRAVTIAPVRAPVKAGQQVGAVTFTQGARLIASMPLVAVHDVASPNPFERVWIALVRGWRGVFGLAPLALAGELSSPRTTMVMQGALTPVAS